MATAENAKIQYESGQTLVAFDELTNQGDNIDFRSSDPLWSNKSGYRPDVKPNGLATGGIATPGAGNSTVTVSAATAYLAGVLESVPAVTNEAVLRGTNSPAEPFRKSSITVTSAGVVAIEAGTAGGSFSNTRGAEGGPPWIDYDAIEIGQIWPSSADDVPITASDIRQVIGTHVERYDYPTWEENRYRVDNGILGNAGITFAAALPAIHSEGSPDDPKPKQVFAEYYEPEFSDIPRTEGFAPPETSHSVTSTQIYGGTIGASSSTLNQGSFTAYLDDGISDGLLKEKNGNLFFKFYQDRLSSIPYLLTQGTFGITRSYPAANQITADCTISAEVPAAEVLG